MYYVELRRLVKRYGVVTAVNDVSLEVSQGEFLVLLGPSGSGKSTILKAIAGIEMLDSGEIWLDGTRVDGIRPQLRDIAMVFQSYALYPHMSVFNNLAFPLRSARIPPGVIEERVAEVVDLLGLDALLRRRPGQLSGGQQQRVALGRAIVRRPRLFLMDEPLSNLDAKLRAGTRLELSKLHDRLGATTIYVTHDQVEAMTMGHRIAVMDDGLLRQVDRPEDVYNYPGDLVVAGFVGSPPMNCIPMKCRPLEGLIELLGDGIKVSFPTKELDQTVRDALPIAGADVVAGIRPECLRLDDHTLPRTQMFDAVVERVELLGNERVIHLSTGCSLAARVAAAINPRPGARVQVGLPAEALRMFDPITKKALVRG